MENKKQNEVVVKLSKSAGITDAGNLHVYVVNAGGKIVETAPFKGDEAVLSTSKASLDGKSKVYVAQALPAGMRGSKKTERTLLKMKAYEVVKNFNGNNLSISRLPSVVTNPYQYGNCLITGHVNKNFIIDGKPVNLPLCDLQVYICEVETELRWPYIPIYYRQIPDWVISEIAQKIVNLPPDPIGPVSGTKINLPLRSLTAKRSLQTASKSQTVNLPQNVMSNLMSGSVDVIRQTMIDYHDLLYPYFCYWPVYWPYIYTYDEQTMVTTDCNGHFEMWENTFSEDGALNIYIYIKAKINGQWVTVYSPPLPCNTWWNYACNTDINITLTDPRLEPCNCGVDGPADAVWFRSIGWYASALHIEQNIANTVVVQGASMLNAGCADILGTPISPFGSGLDFKLFCGADIFNAGVTHYRWKYTMIADANLNPIPVGFQVTTIIPGAVSRPYLVKLSATHYETHYAPLGAVGIAPDIACHIPHQDITSETLVPAVDQALSPMWEDIFFDSAYIDSHSLTDGLYRFDLELLSQDAAGHFHVVSVARPTFQVSEANAILNSQDAPNNYLLPQNPLLPASSLSFNVRVDNAPCVANIHDAMLVETSALSGPCGFIKYDNTGQHVDISFEASHPRNFATFSFAVVKGNNTQPTGINPNGYVVSGVGGFALTGGIFTADFTVDSLLNGCPGQAAFSENLHVAALATDGTNRLYAFDYHDTATNTDYNYDAYDVNAFALSNT
ncbi:MAG: hypothetical protein ACHQIM_04620 [Sphingobacteriales bacterium]